MRSFFEPSAGHSFCRPCVFAIVWKQKAPLWKDVAGMMLPICSARIRKFWIATAESCFFLGRLLLRLLFFVARFLVLVIAENYHCLQCTVPTHNDASRRAGKWLGRWYIYHRNTNC